MNYSVLLTLAKKKNLKNYLVSDFFFFVHDFIPVSFLFLVIVTLVDMRL